jgi:hypothetical protein
MRKILRGVKNSENLDGFHVRLAKSWIYLYPILLLNDE